MNTFMKNICDWDKCKEIGLYKAPIEKDNSKKFRLLCLKHIKIFNKNWNYFSDMDESEIEHFIKSDLTWHKPTKSFSSSENFLKFYGKIHLMTKRTFLINSTSNDFKKSNTFPKKIDMH